MLQAANKEISADDVSSQEPVWIASCLRVPREVIVWACHRFALSAADLAALFAERGIIVSREAVRREFRRLHSPGLAAPSV